MAVRARSCCTNLLRNMHSDGLRAQGLSRRCTGRARRGKCRVPGRCRACHARGRPSERSRQVGPTSWPQLSSSRPAADGGAGGSPYEPDPPDVFHRSLHALKLRGQVVLADEQEQWRFRRRSGDVCLSHVQLDAAGQCDHGGNDMPLSFDSMPLDGTVRYTNTSVRPWCVEPFRSPSGIA